MEHFHLAGLDLRDVEHGVDHFEQVFAGEVDLLQVRRHFAPAIVAQRSISISL